MILFYYNKRKKIAFVVIVLQKYITYFDISKCVSIFY